MIQSQVIFGVERTQGSPESDSQKQASQDPNLMMSQMETFRKSYKHLLIGRDIQKISFRIIFEIFIRFHEGSLKILFED